MKKFEIPVWWYELHGGKINIDAPSKDKAIGTVNGSLSNMIGNIEGDTFSDFGDMGIDEEYIKDITALKSSTSTIEKPKEILYKYIKKDFNELSEDIQKAFRKATNIPANISIEVCNDGNIDAYILMHNNYTAKDVSRLISLNWINSDVLDDWEEGLNPFELDEGNLGQSNILFNFLLGITYGKNAMVVGNYSTNPDDDMYNILVPQN